MFSIAISSYLKLAFNYSQFYLNIYIFTRSKKVKSFNNDQLAKYL